ncbi:MAG: 1-acyl-sn-glycerol-3-phosphate acyltransferase [bacterium]|nr:MAG: 1-acyl-sn-glycerol-3-phosphate acyltransferase [bacterium]
MKSLLNHWRWMRIALVTITCISYCELRTALVPRSRKFHLYTELMRFWGSWFLLGNRYTIEGTGNIPRNDAVVFASNHQSIFDIPLFHALLPAPFRWMSREDLFSWPFIGRALRSMKGIPVYRDSHARNRLAWEQGIDTLKNGHSIVIFPEGTWGDREGRMRPFKKGILRISREAGVPVVPVTIVGSNEVNPPFTRKIHPGAIRMIVHPAMGPDTWEGVQDEDWLEELRTCIARPLKHGTDPADAI